MPARYVTISSGDVQFTVDVAEGERPRVVYWGARLPSHAVESIDKARTLQVVPGGPDHIVQPTLSNEVGIGYSGSPGFLAHRDGRDWAFDFRVSEVAENVPGILSVQCSDNSLGVSITYQFSLCQVSGVLSVSCEVDNRSTDDLIIDRCAPLCFPLDSQFTHVRSFTGRWAGEFDHQDSELTSGSFLRENRGGRTSHDNFPGLFLRERSADERRGLCVGFHLAWSGNSRLQVERNSDGQQSVQLSELFFPGEMILEAGEIYRSPEVLAAWSREGFNGASQRFHTYLCADVLDDRTQQRSRPVHFNTWEAVYFDHDPSKLIQLADKAAEVGAERFVLDDGWFGARRNDRAGLGDWTVSKDVYPQGLKPLADHVRQLGMDFGLWFEPEMVNPDSALYREHPDWILRARGVPQIPSRHQLVLDLTRPEVVEHLFTAISKHVEELEVAYIKWDMNRNVQHPGSADGRALVHRQNRSLYGLLHRLRTAFPKLEIESCSSGGGRADFGILRYTDRLWTSDNNDALERCAIQQGATHFFPLRVLGNHVGPRVCHTTGRELSMEFRVTSAFLGQMGLELDLFDEDAQDLQTLRRGLIIYKQYRQLIYSGQYFRLPVGPNYSVGVVVSSEGEEAIVSTVKTERDRSTSAPRLHMVGLNETQSYRVRQIWPQRNTAISSPSIVDHAKLLDGGTVLSGAVLTHVGLQTPVIPPQTGVIYHLCKEGLVL